MPIIILKTELSRLFYQARGKQLKTQCSKESSSGILGQNCMIDVLFLVSFNKPSQLFFVVSKDAHKSRSEKLLVS
jgi:hypothetical protein